MDQCAVQLIECSRGQCANDNEVDERLIQSFCSSSRPTQILMSGLVRETSDEGIPQ